MKNPHAVALGRLGGRKGGPAGGRGRAEALSERRRMEIARDAALSRWGRLPERLRPLFPGYDLEQLRLPDHLDLVVLHVLTRGGEEDRRWLVRRFGDREIPAVDPRAPRARADRSTDVAVGLGADGSSVAARRFVRTPLGESVKVHWEVLTADQEHVLAASATISQHWGAYLAGGAGLALQLGHRQSADFDWFTPRTLPPWEVLKDVQALGLPVHVRQNDEGTFLGHVGGVDYSVFRYRYLLVGRSVTVEGCELASLRDIAAMKMTAIVQRATKRDYVDLDALFRSRRVSLADAISTMKKKFPGVDPSVALRALTYFRDVEQQPMPAMLVNTTWEDVKRGLIRIHDRGLDRGGRAR